jgi:hypothetical protein
MPTIVNGLWLGRKLGIIEELTLRSFTYFGHEFHLWHYEPITGIEIPEGVVLRDGNELLPSNKIFRYPEKMLLNFGGGSYVGFSEIFRYKLLYELGGWWSDLDVACLKNLDEIQEDYFFRNHGVLSVVGNIMKTPPKSELMQKCFERAEREVNAQQTDWHHAIRILCFYIELLGLSHYIHTDACNLDQYDTIYRLIKQAHSMQIVPPSWRFIHWTNSYISHMGVDYTWGSVFEQLCHQYRCRSVKRRALYI